MQNKACVGLWFSTNPPRLRNLFFWIHQSLSPLSPLSPPWFINPRGISVTRNMISRQVIQFPTPYERWTNSRPPGQEKASNARGTPGGGDVEGSIWLVLKFIEKEGSKQINNTEARGYTNKKMNRDVWDVGWVSRITNVKKISLNFWRRDIYGAPLGCTRYYVLNSLVSSWPLNL